MYSCFFFMEIEQASNSFLFFFFFPNCAEIDFSAFRIV